MYKALIIGSGQIAGGFDNPSDKYIYTHAHAYLNNPNTELLGFYDINYQNAEGMAHKWGVQAYKSLEELAEVDIVSICTPDNTHLEIINTSLTLNPRVLFLEKPISNSIEDFNKIKKISKNIPILVNFTRRFVTEFQDLSKKIKHNEFGEFRTGTGYYGKGYYHNGSHMRDLLKLLLGEIQSIETISEIDDYTDNDKTQTAILEISNGKFFMQGTNSKYFEIFEIDLIFSRGRIRILNGGCDIEIYKIKINETLKEYKNLYLANSFSTEIDYAMSNAIDNMVKFLDKQTILLSTVKDFE